MTERTTKVNLIAQASNYIANMELASRATLKLGDSAIATATRQKEASATVGTAFLAIGAVAAVGVGLAIKSFADFDAKMAQVQTLSHATGSQMASLTTDALNAGQKIGFTAGEVADAETEMIKAGISVSDIIGGALPGALTLAAAGQIDVAQATEIATIAMTQFGLKGADIPHVADLLSAGADKALGSVADLGEALKSGGLVSSQFGISLDDTIGTLSAFANAGLIGEVAGTDLRQMLLKLANPSQEAADDMKTLGIEVYNSQGKFVGLDGLAGQLQTKLGGLSEQQRNSTLATIFGSRAIAGANVLYKEGATGIDNWNKMVNDQGFAAQQAAGKMNNLEGDLKKLGAAAQTDLIETGSGANVTLRDLTQTVTSVVSAVGHLPQPILDIGLGFTALVAVTGLVGGGFLTLVPKLAATRVAMSELNITGKSLAVGLGKGGGLAIVLTALAAGLANTGSSAELTADGFEKVDAVAMKLTSGSLNKLFENASNAIVDSTAKTDKFKEALNNSFSGNLFENESSAYKFIDGLDFGLTHLSDTYKTNEAQFKELGTQLADTAATDLPTAQKQFALLAQEAGGNANAFQELFSAMPDYKTKLENLAGAQGITLITQQLNNVAVGKGALAQHLASLSAQGYTLDTQNLGAAATDATGEISDLSDAINGFGKAQFDADDAARAFQAAIDDATAALKENGRTLDITTPKGRANSAALEDIAKTAIQASSTTLDLGGSATDAASKLAAGRANYIGAARAFGETAAQAADAADKMGLIPGNVNTVITTKGLKAAQSDVDVYDAHLRNILPEVTTTVTTKHKDIYVAPPHTSGRPNPHTGGLIGPNGVSHFATGGGYLAKGPGSGTSDSIPAMISNGEYVNTASTVSRLGADFFQRLNRGGNPAPTYIAAPARSAGAAPQINITVPVSAGLISDKTQLARDITDTIKTGLRNGIPADWNKAN